MVTFEFRFCGNGGNGLLFVWNRSRNGRIGEIGRQQIVCCVPAKIFLRNAAGGVISLKNVRLPAVDGKSFATALTTAFVRRARYMMWRTRPTQPRSPNAQCCNDARPAFALRNFRCSHALLPQHCSGLSTLSTRGQGDSNHEP